MAEIGKDINKAKQLLAAGQLVAIPTETVYGLAANALDVGAVTRIFEAKNRPAFDPLIVHVLSLADASPYIRDAPEMAHKLAKRFWPGPLTLLVEKTDRIPDLVTSGLPEVGIRSPRHPLTRSLLQELQFPIAAPSANPFGYISPTTASHVQDQLGEKVAYILDGGPCEIGMESTIVGFRNGKAVVYRTGGLQLEDLAGIAGEIRLDANASSNPKAPGQLSSHYAPRKKLITGDLEVLLRAHAGSSAGILSFQKEYDVPYQITLSPTGDLADAARIFFSALRQLDAAPVDIILAEFVPDVGLGRAINDRLRRASHQAQDHPIKKVS